eukprot:2076390-Alexandrium_andersonii.AAC.1
MREGPKGFAEAWFGDEGPVETEMPNLMLRTPVEKVLKKPAKAKKEEVQKKPAQRAEEDQPDEPMEDLEEKDEKISGEEAKEKGADEQGEQEQGSSICGFLLMFYKKTGAYAVR